MNYLDPEALVISISNPYQRISELEITQSEYIFTGNLMKFEEDVYPFPDDYSSEDKISDIKDWCVKNQYNLSIHWTH